MTAIPLKKVQSSIIESVGYDAASKTLAIKFVAGAAVYHYSNFTQEDYDALMDAGSIGSYFLKNIKPNTAKWPCAKQEVA